MIEETARKGTERLRRLRLGNYVVQTAGASDLRTLQSAVGLLRTMFDDHYVDPDHRSCLLFNGCTMNGVFDFTVRHRQGWVTLSEFTNPWRGPAELRLALPDYVRSVTQYCGSLLAVEAPADRSSPRSEWQEQWRIALLTDVWELTALGLRFLQEDAPDETAYREEYGRLHGHLKRPLEIQVLQVLSPATPRQPITVQGRILFGPLRIQETLPMSFNRGDIILVTVEEFTHSGPLLKLEGVGSCGVSPGDRLFGLQLFYP